MSKGSKIRKYGDLKARVIGHSVSFLIVVLLIILSLFCPFRPLFVVIISLLSIFSLYEFHILVKKKGFRTALFLSSFFSVLYLFFILLKWPATLMLGAALLSFFVFFAMKKNALLAIASSLFGVIYITVPLGCLVAISTQFKGPSNAFWLAFLIFVTKSADMGGYFVGRKMGKHQLAKNLSPHKTIEGAIGAVVASVLMALLLKLIDMHYFNVVPRFSFVLAALFGLILSLFAMLGDLAESLLKRDAQVKDSNNIPSIGGILDVIDALLFTSPILYLLLKFHNPF